MPEAAPPRRRLRGRPIFVDHSGRRRRLMLVVGTAVGTVLLATLGLLIAGLSGASPVRVPGFPDGGQPAQADQSDLADQPQPTSSAGDAAGSIGGQPGSTGAAAESTQNRRVPTHTPAHRPKPTKT